MSNDSSDYESKYKYLLAEYDNYRKRVEREAELKIMNVKAGLLLKLINLKDDFERAIEMVEKSNNESIVDGLKKILKNIDSILKEEGVNVIEAKGKIFDPNLHEVVSIINDNRLPEYTVINELRKGYMLNNKVIRPTLVEVSKKDNLNIE